MCNANHPIPEEGTVNLQKSFHIDAVAELRKKLSSSKLVPNCPDHKIPLSVYCRSCRTVICGDCGFSEKHDKCKRELISNCFPIHHEEIDSCLNNTVKNKLAGMNTAISCLDTAEKEITKQGEQLQEEINMHAQQMIDQVQRSQACLSQKLQDLVQQKKHFLSSQKQQAQSLHMQLNACHQMIENSLKEWTPQQILTEKYTMINEMKTATRHIDPTVFQPIENDNVKFTKTNLTEEGIGFITGTTYGKATLELFPYSIDQPSTATLTLQTQNDLPFSFSPYLLSATLCSDDAHSVKCIVTKTHQEGKYIISITPSTRHDQLVVQIGGANIPDSPFALPVIPTPEMRGMPIRVITELNRPWGTAVCNNGDIVVAECGTHCITILNKQAIKVRSFGVQGINDGEFTDPRGVAITNDQHVLVTDLHRLQKLTLNGVFVKSIGSSDRKGNGELEFDVPTGIAVHPTEGYIYVADSSNNRIQVFDSNLSFFDTITLNGDDSFNDPCDVALDIQGNVFVVEHGNHCVTKVATNDHRHKCIKRFGSEGSAPGQFRKPICLCIGNGLVYVCNYSNGRISIFDTDGHFKHCFGQKGSGEIEEFDNILGIAIDSLGNFLYVSDTDKIVMC